MAMANSSGSSGVGIMIYGINPEFEKKVTKIHTLIQENGGSYFEAESRKVPPVVISEKTAIKLFFFILILELGFQKFESIPL